MKQRPLMTGTRLRRVARKLGKGALNAVCLIFAVVTYSIAMMFFMVSGDGIEFRSLHEPLEVAITEKADARSVAIGEVRLVRDVRGRDPLKLTITDFMIDQGEGRVVELPKISMRIDGASMLRGRILPKFVEIDGATVAIERREEDIAMGGSIDIEALLQLADLISEVRGGGFEGAVLNDFTFSYADIAAGTRFSAEGGTASLKADNGDYDFEMVVPFEGQDASLRLDAATRANHGGFSAKLHFDRAPMAELLEIFFADNEQMAFDVPVSGAIQAGGSLIDGLTRLSVDLDVGEGAIRVRDNELPVTSLSVRGSHHVLNRTLTIEVLEFEAAGAKGSLAGDVSYETAERGMSGIDFNLEADELTIIQQGLFNGPLPLENVKLLGGYDVAMHEIALSQIEAGFFESVISGSGSLTRVEGAGSPAIKANIGIDGKLNVEQVLRGWPVPAADGARRWVVDNMPKADVSGVTFEMDVPAGGITKGGISDEALIDLNFNAENATVIYAPGMTPVTDLSASGQIFGNSFTVKTKRGRIGPVSITGGGITMPQLVPKGGLATFTVVFDGQVADILAIVDEEPLGYISDAGFSADSFTGTGDFTLSIIRPLLDYVPLEDYRFDGEGTFAGVTFEPFGATLPLQEGSGQVALTEKGMTIAGLASVEGVPASFEWTRPFGNNIKQTLTAEAKITPRAADAVGIPLRRFLRGEIRTRLTATGDMNGFQDVEFKADLGAAALFLENGRLLKGQGEEGQLSLKVSRPRGVPIILVDHLLVSMPGANIEGNARFTPQGGLIDMDLPRLWVANFMDMSLRLTRDDRRVKLAVTGAYADASGLIDTLLGSNSSKNPGHLPGGIDLDVSLERLSLKGETDLLGVELTAHHDGAEMARLEASGTFAGGGRLDVVLEENDQGLGEDVTLVTDRFDRLVNGVFGITSVTGGDARLTATFIDEGPLVGQLSANNLILRDAPTLARLLSIGSLDGLANVLNGEGLEFTVLDGDFQLEDGQLRLVDARMTGAALGLSANGVVELGESSFKLHGAVAPAYQINGMFGAIPGLGDLFVSRRGEGIFALAYRVDGPTSDATVQVNTLAALTPGIFRRIFEPVGDDAPTTTELLEAAEEAAGNEAARDFLSTPELLREYERDKAARQTDSRPE